MDFISSFSNFSTLSYYLHVSDYLQDKREWGQSQVQKPINLQSELKREDLVQRLKVKKIIEKFEFVFYKFSISF